MKENLKSKSKIKWIGVVVTMYLPMWVFVWLAWSCKSGQDKAAGTEVKDVSTNKVYTCPMHPEIVRQVPGLCPICNMTLVPREISLPGTAADTALSNKVSANITSGIETTQPAFKNINGVISLPGYITYQPERTKTISSKVEGRIEKLYIKSLYQRVVKGQPLLEIYSHSLLTAQREYLFLKRDDSDARLLNMAKEKLMLLGMSATQVDRLKVGAHVHSTTTIYSPYSGVITGSEMTIDNNVTGNGNTMSNASPMPIQATPNSTEIPRVGDYVAKGAQLFQIANTDQVWGIFEIFPLQLSYLKVGLPMEVFSEAYGKAIPGKINFIEPVSGSTGTTKLRVVLDNKDGKLKRAGVISARVTMPDRKALVLPSKAVLDLGNKTVVFVKAGEEFIPKTVRTGILAGDEIEIVSGITPRDTVAGNAGIMVDSEGLVKVNGN